MKKLKALISLSKPNIILSVGLTGLTGMILANRGIPDIKLVFFTMISLILSASGAAMINNIIEQDKDKLMERLSKRVEKSNNHCIIFNNLFSRCFFLSYQYN